MKKLFSFLCLLMLGAGMSMQAQETSIRGEDSLPLVVKDNQAADEIVGPYRAPQSTYSFFEEPTYIRLDLQSGSNFKIRYGGQTVGVIGFFNPVTLYSSTDIRGTFSFNSSYSTNCNNQSNFYTLAQRSGSNNWYADNIHGTFTITSTGTTDSDGDQVYLVTLNGTLHSTMRYESCGAYPIYHSKQLAIVAYNGGTKYTLKNSTVISTSATNGTVSGGGTYYDVNQNITLTPNPNTGYHFVNWNGGNTQNPRTVQVGHNDVTYTANFAINTYTVVFNANGGTGSMSNQAFTYGTAQNLTSNTTSITRSGYTFGGWATTAQRANDGIVDYTNGQSVNNLTTTHNGTVNLYAVWNEIPVTPFTLILDANAHGTVSVYDITKGKYVNFTDNEAEVGEGHEIRITATPDAGYHVATLTFADEPFESGGEFEMSDDGLAIVARFELDVYDITYKDKGNGNFTGTHGANHPTTHTYGTATALVNPTKSGAVFGGWYTTSDCSGDAITSLGATAYTAGPITLYAKWANNGTITANASPEAGGSVTVNQPSTAGGTAVTLTPSANSGYVFSQWSDGNSDNPRTVYVDGSVNYTAQFIVEPAAWGSYSYDNANDNIEVDIEEGANNICDSYWTPYGGDFLYIIASNHTRSTSNYVQLYFKTNTMNYTYPDGQLGVAPGTYLTTTPGYTTNQCGDYTYWFWRWNDIPWEGAVAYTYDDYALGLNDQSCYAADVNYSGSSPSVTQRYKIGNYNDGSEARITVSVGKDGHMHVQVRKVADNTLLINIGEPASLHNVSITAPTNGTVTVSYNDGSAQSFTSGSRSIAEGTVLTVTTSPAADYHFNAWTGNGAASVTVDGAKTIGATFAQNDYFLNATYGAGGASVTRDDSGNSETVKRAGNTVTLTPTAASGYNFLAWGGTDAAKMSGNVFTFPTNGTHNTTYNVQATFQTITYDLTYNGLEGATHSNPATYTVETATITLTDPSAREGYTFTGWTCGGNAITQITLGSTGDKTITANWAVASLTLLDNEDAAYYNDFKEDNHGIDVESLTYERTFKVGNWSTVCLPFDVDDVNMESVGWNDKVYEFRYAQKNGDYGWLLYLNKVTAMKAGKGYLFRTTSAMGSTHTFEDVTIDARADNQDDVNDLTGYNESGDMTLVGTLRAGTLTANTNILVLKDNKLYYPGASGIKIRAYRGFFFDSTYEGTGLPTRVRIVVEGEVATDLEVVNGELIETDNAPVKKYMQDGVLVIERNGVKYDAQGKRL